MDKNIEKELRKALLRMIDGVSEEGRLPEDESKLIKNVLSLVAKSEITEFFILGIDNKERPKIMTVNGSTKNFQLAAAMGMNDEMSRTSKVLRSIFYKAVCVDLMNSSDKEKNKLALKFRDLILEEDL